MVCELCCFYSIDKSRFLCFSIERTVSAEFRHVDRTVQVFNMTEVNIELIELS